MDVELMDLIKVEQEPIITDRLGQVVAYVDTQVKEAMSLACTSDALPFLKKTRAEVNKLIKAGETARKTAKAEALAPYEKVVADYNERFANPLKEAERTLAQRINETEDIERRRKQEAIESYYCEYRQSVGIPSEYVPFSSARINITLSASEKSLKAEAKSFLDRIAGELAVIDTMTNKDEVLFEYLHDLNLPKAVQTVEQRKAAIEAAKERQRIREEQRLAEIEAENKVAEIVETIEPVEALSPPTVQENVEIESVPVVEKEPVYETTFVVRGSIEKLKLLKNFLISGGYDYEQQ